MGGGIEFYRAAAERDADRHLEPSLDELVEHADDAVELVDGEVLERDAPDEVHVAEIGRAHV